MGHLLKRCFHALKKKILIKSVKCMKINKTRKKEEQGEKGGKEK